MLARELRTEPPKADAVVGQACSHAVHHPTLSVVFHSKARDSLPQQLAGLRPNDRPRDLATLARLLGLPPAPKGRLRRVAPEAKFRRLQPLLRPYEALGLQVLPLRLRLPELGQAGLTPLLGEGDAGYVRRMLEEAARLGPVTLIDRPPANPLGRKALSITYLPSAWAPAIAPRSAAICSCRFWTSAACAWHWSLVIFRALRCISTVSRSCPRRLSEAACR